jgi:hypothetical protein
VVSEHQEVKAHLSEVLEKEKDGRKGRLHGGRDGGGPSLGWRAAAGQGEANGVVELDRGGVEVGVRWWTGAYRRKENGGEVAPVEVGHGEWFGSFSGARGNFLRCCGGAGRIGGGCPRRTEGRRRWRRWRRWCSGFRAIKEQKREWNGKREK